MNIFPTQQYVKRLNSNKFWSIFTKTLVNLLSSSFASGIGCLARMLERTLFVFVVAASVGGDSLFVLNELPIVFTNGKQHIKIIFHYTLAHIKQQVPQPPSLKHTITLLPPLSYSYKPQDFTSLLNDCKRMRTPSRHVSILTHIGRNSILSIYRYKATLLIDNRNIAAIRFPLLCHLV